MHTPAWVLVGMIGLLAAPAFALDPPGVVADQASWARWQGRLSLGRTAAAGPSAPNLDAAPLQTGASLMGDYYFSRTLGDGPGRLGGFRATSGLIFGPGPALRVGQPTLAAGGPFSIGSRLFGPAAAAGGVEPAADTATLPYVGFGYTELSARSRWAFSADLGLVGKGSGSAARLGRFVSGGQSLDDAIREMRLAPLVQVGVSYAF